MTTCYIQSYRNEKKNCIVKDSSVTTKNKATWCICIEQMCNVERIKRVNVVLVRAFTCAQRAHTRLIALTLMLGDIATWWSFDIIHPSRWHTLTQQQLYECTSLPLLYIYSVHRTYFTSSTQIQWEKKYYYNIYDKYILWN